MTATEYNKAMNDIHNHKPIHKSTYDNLQILANQCKARAKHLNKTGHKNEASLFKDTKSEIRIALANAIILETEVIPIIIPT